MSCPSRLTLTGRQLSRRVELLAEIDLALAAGRLSAEQRASKPHLSNQADGRTIQLHGARHPLLGKSVVPINVEMDQAHRVVVITGPNTGGKTVALKTLGLLTLMAQSGLHIPADPGGRLVVFGHLFADIGDEQSIEQSLSTFSSHMTHVIEALDLADDNTLILLDEIGAGTDPEEGSALARATIVHLLAKGSWVVATTHFSELKVFAHETPAVINAAVEFDPGRCLRLTTWSWASRTEQRSRDCQPAGVGHLHPRRCSRNVGRGPAVARRAAANHQERARISEQVASRSGRRGSRKSSGCGAS